MGSSLQEEIIRLAASKGVLIDPLAVRELENKNDAIERLQTILHSFDNPPLIITHEMISGTGPETAEIAGHGEPVGTVGHISSTPSPPKILKDITGNSTSRGNVKDFAKYFTDRFHSLKKILMRRGDMAGALPISRAVRLNRDISVIGIVNSVHTTRNGHKILEIEDEEERCKVLLMADRKDDYVLKDEVIGVKGRMNRERTMIVADAVVRPDVPFNRSVEKVDSTSKVAVLSDTHVGSKTFLREEWDLMLDWLKRAPEARDINYIIISGDLADGIGVYPDQEEDLEIDDVYAQYQRVAQYLSELPDWMRLILMPGNHDAVRPAEPQPTFQTELQKMFDSRVTFVGNPATVEIEGRNVLAYHGRSFDDVISSLPHLSWERPIDAMKELLKRRHLAPVYGEKTPLAPEKRDYMVIDEVPDVFITGHVHSYGLDDYRGVRLISGSTWQSQTSYQKMRNISPIPAKMPVFDLASLNLNVVNFSEFHNTQKHSMRRVV